MTNLRAWDQIHSFPSGLWDMFCVLMWIVWLWAWWLFKQLQLCLSDNPHMQSVVVTSHKFWLHFIVLSVEAEPDLLMASEANKHDCKINCMSEKGSSEFVVNIDYEGRKHFRTGISANDSAWTRQGLVWYFHGMITVRKKYHSVVITALKCVILKYF